MVKTLISLLILMFSISDYPLFAQKVVKVKKAEGRWEVSDNMTLAGAEERAFLEAKKEALRKAGVMENIWSVFGQITQENGEEFQEAYSQMSAIAIGGMINVTKKETVDQWDPEAKRLYKIVTIDATVKHGEEEDRNFVLEVKGIEPVYKESELFSCTIKVHGIDSFLRFFWFDETGGALLFPNEYEEDQLFKAGETYKLPMNPNIEYEMKKTDTEKVTEKVNIMIVATKTKIPYIGAVNYASLLKWIYTIPADQRCTFYQMALIK